MEGTGRVLEVFDHGMDCGKELLIDFLDRLLHEEAKEKIENVDYGDIAAPCFEIAFAAGFLYGGIFQVEDPEVKGILNALKQRLIKEKVLTYLPKRGKEEPQVYTAK